MSNPIHAHLQATAALIHAALEQMQHEDATAFQGTTTAFSAGAHFRVVTTMAAHGVCAARVCLVAPDGQVANLADVAFNLPKERH